MQEIIKVKQNLINLIIKYIYLTQIIITFKILTKKQFKLNLTVLKKS